MQEDSNEVQEVRPPAPPSLLSKPNQGVSFGVCPSGIGTQEELKLSIEFPLLKGKNGNDIAMFFKRFCTVLFTANKDIQLVKWDKESTENPIVNAADIGWDEATISEFYTGMKRQSDGRRMIGFTQIMTPEPFWKIKENKQFFEWLQDNKVWVKPTVLSSSQHVKIGWLLRSHPSYTNYERATKDLILRIGNEGAELELSPHTITHTTAGGSILRTRALKVVITEE